MTVRIRRNRLLLSLSALLGLSIMVHGSTAFAQSEAQSRDNEPVIWWNDVNNTIADVDFPDANADGSNGGSNNNRSGHADGTNPGNGSSNNNSNNGGTDNPGGQKKGL